MRLSGFGPEIGNREPPIEVGAEVVHDTNREEDVHAELYNTSVRYKKKELIRDEGTLKTSRLGPPIVKVILGGFTWDTDGETAAENLWRWIGD